MDASKPTSEQAARPSPPPPLEADDQLVIRVITAGWAVALVVLLIVRNSLPPGQRWWIWTCVCGVAFGLFGLWYVPRLKRRRARTAVPVIDEFGYDLVELPGISVGETVFEPLSRGAD